MFNQQKPNSNILANFKNPNMKQTKFPLLEKLQVHIYTYYLCTFAHKQEMTSSNV